MPLLPRANTLEHECSEVGPIVSLFGHCHRQQLGQERQWKVSSRRKFLSSLATWGCVVGCRSADLCFLWGRIQTVCHWSGAQPTPIQFEVQMPGNVRNKLTERRLKNPIVNATAAYIELDFCRPAWASERRIETEKHLNSSGKLAKCPFSHSFMCHELSSTFLATNVS